jgi:hypothetical protein
LTAIKALIDFSVHHIENFQRDTVEVESSQLTTTNFVLARSCCKITGGLGAISVATKQGGNF